MANSLGFTFNGETITYYDAIPETFLVEVAKLGNALFYKESRLFSLTRTWVHFYAKFLRVDALKKLSKDMQGIELSILGSFCLIAKEADSSKWNGLLEDILKRTKSFRKEIIPRDILENNKDLFLAKFGIYYRSLRFQSSRKFRSLEWLLKNNHWIKNRLIMTVSPRADIFTYLFFHRNKRDIGPLIDCVFASKSTVYNIREEYDLLITAFS